MATDAKQPTPQTPTTSDPISSNTQDFSGSDDEILDNFAEGPDDGTPMGLGGEKGKQAEPASSTLEADIVGGVKTQDTGETSPPETASEPEPAEEPAGEKESEEPETPEFPSTLLQMAGYADADAAKAAGFESPESLFAAVKWRSQLLQPGAEPAQPSAQGLYRRRQPPKSDSAAPAPAPKAEETTESKPFELPAEKLEMLDEDLVSVLREMHSSQQQELQSLRQQLQERENMIASQQEQNEEAQFDEAVQNLGEHWRDVFGEGSGSDLAQAGQSDPMAMTNFNHRAMLFEAVEAVREVNAKQGYKPMSLEQEIHWALMQRYPDKFQQAISGNSSPKANSGRGVVASRPTQRRTPPKSHNDKLLSSIDGMLRKRKGYSLDMGEPEEEFDGEV